MIEQLKEYPQSRRVFVRYQDPIGESDYWELKKQDIRNDAVEDPETGKGYPAILIGDDRV